MGGGQWREVEATLATLLGKVRGDSRTALVALLEHRGTLPRARRRTRGRGAVRRARAAELLGSAGGPRGVPDLIRLLRDRDRDVRIVSARALGRARADTAAGPLMLALEGDRPVPASVVSYALLQLGPTAERTLMVGARAGSDLVRGVAVETLGALGAVRAVVAVTDRLANDPALDVRVRAARALGRLGMPTAADPLLAATRPGEPEALRVAAADALGELGDPPAAARLELMLADPAPRVAAAAARSLLRLGAPGLLALARAAGGDAAAAPTRHAREALARGALTGLLENSDPDEVRAAAGRVQAVA